MPFPKSDSLKNSLFHTITNLVCIFHLPNGRARVEVHPRVQREEVLPHQMAQPCVMSFPMPARLAPFSGVLSEEIVTGTIEL